MISSTGVTLTYARESRRQEAIGSALTYGVIGACTILYLRVPIILLIFNRDLAFAAIPYLVLPFLAGALLLLGSLRAKKVSGELPPPRNPLGLQAALIMAVLFQTGLYLVTLVTGRFGGTGLLISAALLGLTDVDALTFAMLSLGSDLPESHLAGPALAIGVLSNTALKAALAVLIGKGQFRRTAGIGLAVMMLMSAAALVYLLMY